MQYAIRARSRAGMPIEWFGCRPTPGPPSKNSNVHFSTPIGLNSASVANRSYGSPVTFSHTRAA